MNRVVLSSIIDLISGGTPKTNVPEYWNGDIGWLSVTDFNNDLRYVYDTEKKITTLGVKESNTKYLNKGDIIISARGTVGALAQIGTPMCFNQSCFGIRGKKDKADTDFLYYALKNYVKNIIKRSQGSVFDTINLASFDLMELDIPKEIKTQQKIAKVLSNLDAKIELNNKINQELEAMAKLLYDYWFVQFDFPNEQGKPYKSSGGKMVYNKELKREIPEGWEVKNIGNIANIIAPHPSHRAPKEVINGFPFAGDEFGNINISKARVINEDFVLKQEGDYEINDTSLGYGRVGTVGKVVRLRKQDFKYALSPTMAVINPKENSSFVYFVVKAKSFYKEALKRTSGTTRPAIGIMELRKIPVVVPRKDSPIISDFCKKVDGNLKHIENLNKQNQYLIKLRDWLLPMLMNGQVTVGEAEEKLNMAAEPQSEYGKVVNANFTEREFNTSERAILAAYIVKMVGHNEIGKTKLMKLLHLTEYICRIKLGSHFVKQTAGPYDEAMINDIHRVFRQFNLFKVETTKKGSFSEIHYIPSFEFGQIEERFLEIYRNEVVRVNDLLNRMKGWKLKHCEILSTLYAVWNNRIKRNQSTKKHLLKKDFFEWSNRKKRIFTENEVDKSIEWMKRKNIVPTGWGDFVEEIA